jgi:ABC transporter substrate binding protein
MRPLAVLAQQLAAPVIGFLHAANREAYAPMTTAFRQGLRETGYVEGQNVVIEYRWADGRLERLPELAADLVRRRVSVIFTGGGSDTPLAVKAATPTIPILFANGTDPVEAGLPKPHTGIPFNARRSRDPEGLARILPADWNGGRDIGGAPLRGRVDRRRLSFARTRGGLARFH